MQQRVQIEGGTYDVIRRRLEGQADELRKRTDQLNERRQNLFGSSVSELINTERVHTEYNCLPRDLIAIEGSRMLLGYQVFMGLKQETKVEDVFVKLILPTKVCRLFRLNYSTTNHFAGILPNYSVIIKTPNYCNCGAQTHVLMIFQTGARASDLQVLRWAVDGNTVAYLDNRGERDHVFPNPHDFEWIATGRDNHCLGVYPHINILDEIFVECTGGDLTIKIENNTESGAGIYAEPVDERNQSLDDAEISYADLEGCIVLKILPYRETEYRYFVYNRQTQEAVRIDTIGTSCQQLPEGHGLIFPNGYYLANGSYKVFPHEATDFEYVRQLKSPNGEDIAYIYHHRVNGMYVILQYNLIRREVTNPLQCHGYSRLPDGRIILMRGDTEPSRVHAMQVWQTPFCSEEYAASQPHGDGSYLSELGNREMVRGISDMLHIHRQVQSQQPNAVVYEELLKLIDRSIDSYHWLSHEEAFGLQEQLQEIRGTANTIIDEFEKVRQLQEQARAKVHGLEAELRELIREIDISGQNSIDDFVSALDQLRRKNGQIDTARSLRYVDLVALDELGEQVAQRISTLSQNSVNFLLEPTSLDGYRGRIVELEQQAEKIEKVADATEIQEAMDQLGQGLDLLMEIVNTLEIDDTTARTDILERISEVYGQLNRAKAILQARRRELGSGEARAEFGAQFKLLSQSVTNYLALCDTPAKTDEFLAKLMVQLEELEGQFIEFDEFTDQLSAKRDEVYASFQDRKQQLLDDLQRQANALGRSGERILGSIAKRVLTFSELDDLNAYLASDPMVQKLRSLTEQLQELGDTVKADELAGRLKSAREDAVRHLRDRSELFDGDTISFGKHRFSVNTQDLELTMLRRDDNMVFHLTGTGYYGDVDRDDFLATQEYWDQDLVSENNAVYRAEYLAWQIIDASERGVEGLDEKTLQQADFAEGELLELVRRFAAQRYEEQYERGLHDADTVKILAGLIHLRSTCDLLRFHATARAMALLWWLHVPNPAQQKALAAQARSFARLRTAFGPAPEHLQLCDQLGQTIAAWCSELSLPDPGLTTGNYLIEELGLGDDLVAIMSGESEDLVRAFYEQLGIKNLRDVWETERKHLQNDLVSLWNLTGAWVDGFLADRNMAGHALRNEVIFLLIVGDA